MQMTFGTYRPLIGKSHKQQQDRCDPGQPSETAVDVEQQRPIDDTIGEKQT